MGRKLTYEFCKEVVSTCKTLQELYEKDKSVYGKIRKQEWFDLIDHLDRLRELTYDFCKTIASKFKTKYELYLNDPTVLDKIYEKKWFDIFELFEGGRRKLTYDFCKSVASNFNHISDLQDHDPCVYGKINDNEWKELLSHMTPKTNLSVRCIYFVEFKNKVCYVGLTCDYKRRIYEHLTDKGSVYDYIQEKNEIPTFTQITDYMSEDESQVMEDYYEKYYTKNGYTLLNKKKTGALGGGYERLTYNVCKEILKEYVYKSDVRKDGYDSVLKKVYQKEWFELSKHLQDKPYPNRKGGNNQAARKVMNISTKEVYGCASEVAQILGITPNNLRRKLRGERKNTTGYVYCD